MPLHIDHRPNNLDDFMGNRALVLSLKSVLEREDIPHVFLFQGPSGCGKTTLGRIIANRLGCKGNDLSEIDSGSERGVETADKIKNMIRYFPMESKARVVILDEVHATSKKFQDSLLKTLEDKIPSHSYFILCSTDPQKLLTTIKNRCSSYTVSKLNQKEIINLLKTVLEKEGVNINYEVLKSIAENAEGCPRQALIILDQIIDMNEEDMLEGIQSAQVKEKQVIELCRALLCKKSWRIIADIIKNLESDPETIRRAVRGYCNSVLLNSDNQQAFIILECFEKLFYSDKAMVTQACYDVYLNSK